MYIGACHRCRRGANVFLKPSPARVPCQSIWRSRTRNCGMLPPEKSKEVTVSLKCGLMRGQHLIGDFQFVSWSYNEQKPYLTYPGLASRLKTVFSNVAEPFNIILIDDDNDRIILPGDDMKETITALNCFRHRYPAPLRVFLQLPPEPVREEPIKEEQQIQSLSKDTHSELSNGVKILIEKVEKIYETLRNFNEQVSNLLETIANQNKARDNQAIIHAHVSDESIGPASTPSNIQPVASSIARSDLSSSSSSASSRMSHYDEDDWTPVDHGDAPRRRRRLTTTSSCASQEPLKEDIMQLMADEFDTVMMGFQRNP